MASLEYPAHIDLLFFLSLLSFFFSSTCYYCHTSDQIVINAIVQGVLHFSSRSTSKQHQSDPFHLRNPFSSLSLPFNGVSVRRYFLRPL